MNVVTMTQALKKLYKAVVGEDTTKNNPTKIVNELADNYSGGGSGGSLPSVTASDNGMVLTVVEGSWDKAASSGGAEPFIANLGDSGDYATLDKKWEDICDAVEDGKTVWLKSTESDGFFYKPLVSIAEDLGTYKVTFYYDGSSSWTFDASSATDYPVMSWD